MLWALGTAVDIMQAETAKQFDITISAEGPYGPITPYNYRIDLEKYRLNARYAPGNLSGVTSAIQKLTATIEKK